MLTLYTTPSCTSCRKAKKWLQQHKIEFVEKNFYHVPMTEDELKRIFMLTENGTEDIISKRSNEYQKMSGKVENLSVSELFKVIEAHPSILRRPIMIDERRLQIGFNEDEIRVFLPREVRKKELAQALLLTGI